MDGSREDRGHAALADSLEGMAYPCDRDQLLRHASAMGAADDVLGHIGTLSEHDRYADLDGIERAMRAASDQGR